MSKEAKMPEEVKPVVAFKAGRITADESAKMEKKYIQWLTRGRSASVALILAAKFGNRRVPLIQNSAQCPWAKDIVMEEVVKAPGKRGPKSRPPVAMPTFPNFPTPSFGFPTPALNLPVPPSVAKVRKPKAEARQTTTIAKQLTSAETEQVASQYAQFQLAFPALYDLASAFQKFHAELRLLPDPVTKSLTLAAADQLLISFVKSCAFPAPTLAATSFPPVAQCAAAFDYVAPEPSPIGGTSAVSYPAPPNFSSTGPAIAG